MERLTELDYCGYDIKGRQDFNGYENEKDCQKIFSCLQKLGQLEDIEEELGVDLITYFKLKKGTKVYTNSPWLKEECVIESVFGVGKDITYHICPSMYEKCGGYVGIEEYGTTFALTKEELENYGK